MSDFIRDKIITELSQYALSTETDSASRFELLPRPEWRPGVRLGSRQLSAKTFKTCYKDTIAKANRRNEARASWHCGHWSCQCFFGVTPEACTKTQMSQTKHSAKKKNQPAEVSCHQGDELCLFGEGFQVSFNALSKNRCIRCVWFECACFCKIPKTCPTTHNPIYVYFHTNPSLIL